jgi:hypothetical protein
MEILDAESLRLAREQWIACDLSWLLLYRQAGHRLTQAFLDLVSSGSEFLYRLAHSAGEFRKFLGTEKEQDDQKDHDHVWSGEIEEAGKHWSHKDVLFGGRLLFTPFNRFSRLIFPAAWFILSIPPGK